MKIRVKKLHDGRIIKLESGGEIKEVMIHEDMFDKEKGKISICFRGHRNSGIVELTEKEANELYRTLGSKINLIKDIKIIRG
ncbi:hypothetical protein J4218_01925 [Candidatus Pacearchaeota archaeon]|nr:hypothetical protein [uncultured archaeon]MBS3078855.1 hypothetical protein [Candidatus Pacearchaeota archaeon]